jgi:hypothetical protein
MYIGPTLLGPAQLNLYEPASSNGKSIVRRDIPIQQCVTGASHGQ